MRVSGLGSFYFFHFDFSFIYDRWPAFKSADERPYNKLCRTSVVAVLRRGLDKSPMRQIRYPHVYDIYIYMYRCTHAHTYVRRPIVTSVNVGGEVQMGTVAIARFREWAEGGTRGKLNCRSSTKGLSARGIARCCRNGWSWCRC